MLKFDQEEPPSPSHSVPSSSPERPTVLRSSSFATRDSDWPTVERLGSSGPSEDLGASHWPGRSSLGQPALGPDHRRGGTRCSPTDRSGWRDDQAIGPIGLEKAIMPVMSSRSWAEKTPATWQVEPVLVPRPPSWPGLGANFHLYHQGSIATLWDRETLTQGCSRYATRTWCPRCGAPHLTVCAGGARGLFHLL